METTFSAMSVGVLNASYAPLGDTKMDRALAMVLDGKAVIEEADESRYVRSIGGIKLPLPKVIRLLKALKVPFYVGTPIWTRHGVLDRDHRKCGYCLGPAATVDHIDPKSRGGRDEWMNTIAACLRCNSKKANNRPEEAGMALLFEPTTPQKLYLQSGKKPRKKDKSA